MQFSLLVLTFVAISNNGINSKSPTRIVSGKRVEITAVPFAAMIRHRLSHNSTHALICGGTMISYRHILTAAHCFFTNGTDPFDSHHPRWFDVILGEGSYHSNVVIYKIEEVFSHINYTHKIRGGVGDRADIAVIKLETEIPPSTTRMPIELVSEEPKLFSEALAYGWGVTNPNKTDSLSHTLQGLIMEVYHFKDCKRNYERFTLARDELCVIAIDHNNGALCYGDSGGPLIVNKKLAGVISSTLSCEGPTLATVVNVAYHKSWIERAVKGIAEAKTYFATNIRRSHDRQSSRPSQRRDELSSRYKIPMIN